MLHTFLARKLLLRPPHRGRPEFGPASGSEGVWGLRPGLRPPKGAEGERGAEKERRALLKLIRAGDFGGEDVVAESFMRLKHHC